MPFPEVPKVRYSKNPLDAVVCQVRFPVLLQIDAEVPSLFHNKIKTIFSEYREKIEIQHDFTITQNDKLPLDAQGIIKNSQTIKNHEFYDETDTWKVNLTRNFVSLSTSRYVDWDDFNRKLNQVLEGIVSVYGVQHYTRVGLRYVDIFNRSDLELHNVAWSELINVNFIGILASEFTSHVKNIENVVEFTLADSKSSVRIATKFVIHKQTNEICFVLDSDFSKIEKIPSSDVNPVLSYLHDRASRLLNWATTEKLRQAMLPEPKI